jgi:polyisoprenoid-binding protein YceI
MTRARRRSFRTTVTFSSPEEILMSIRIAALAAAAFVSPAMAQETYVVDPVHSQPVWETRHIGMALQRGSFGKIAGKITLDRAAKKGTVDITIDANSIKPYDPRLDSVLRGERFFNVAKFPTIEFKSDDVVFDGDRVVRVNGNFTLVGVTKPVTLQVADFKCGEQAFNKKPMCAADATATIKRSDYGITDGLNVGNPADEIRLLIPVEA